MTFGSSQKIESAAELADFIGRLASDIESGKTPLSNDTVVAFLDALAGCLEDFEGRCLHQGIDPASVNPYTQFADALDAATVYD